MVTEGVAFSKDFTVEPDFSSIIAIMLQKNSQNAKRVYGYPSNGFWFSKTFKRKKDLLGTFSNQRNTRINTA